VGYNIEITTSDDEGWTVSDTFQAFFDGAIQKWTTIITDGLMDVSLGPLAGTDTSSLGDTFGTCPYPATVDDLWICASAGDFGPRNLTTGNIFLGSATVLNRRSGSFGLPATGLIVFNNEALGDVPNEDFASITLALIGFVVSGLSLVLTFCTQGCISSLLPAHIFVFFSLFDFFALRYIAWYRNLVG
jgi:hypothetical protein